MERSFHMLLFRPSTPGAAILAPGLKELGFGSGQPKLVDYLDRRGPAGSGSFRTTSRWTRRRCPGCCPGLEKRGYVVRRVDGARRRRDLVEVTPAGREAVARWRLRSQEAEDVMLRGFTEEERARFAQYLARAYENFRAERGGDRPCTS